MTPITDAAAGPGRAAGQPDPVAARDRPPTSDRHVMAQTFAYLFGLGATLVALTLLLPHAADRELAGVIGPGVAAAAVSALSLWSRGRLPLWFFQALPLCGTLLASIVVYSGGAALVGQYATFYFWVVLAAFYFFERRWAALNLLVVGVAYAAVLALRKHVVQPEQDWLIMMWTLGAAGVLLLTLREHVEALIGRLAHSAREAVEQNESLAAIATASRALSHVGDPDQIKPAVCIGARAAAQAKIVALYEPSADGRGLGLTAHSGPELLPARLLFTGGPAPAPRVFSSGEPLFVSDLGLEGLEQAASEGDSVALGSGLWHPVARGEVTVAVLALIWEERWSSIPSRTASLVALLAEETAAAIERARTLEQLEQTARTDSLTGLPNRRAWDEALAREMARAERDRRPLSIAMLDLDYFKDYNDEHGHLAGDRLLKQLAGAWGGQIRPMDTLARFGGEEFSLACPGCDGEHALALVERLRAATPHGETCSAGLAVWDFGEDSEALLERADRALYAAKQDGRDKTLFAV